MFKNMQEPNQSFEKHFPAGEGVLVTGCSSGIGHAIAIYLAQRGFTVFATVRKESDANNFLTSATPLYKSSYSIT